MIKRVAMCFVVFLEFIMPVASMELSVDTWNGHKVLLARGEITSGDADKFELALGKIDRLPHGAKVILLDSPGGSVREALRVSKIIHISPTHMVVPREASCASACASILFVAGKYRTVEDGGRLGQHSCSVHGNADFDCNEIIAQHAFENGISHGSIAAFLTTIGPEDILWFSREEVDCWGISRYPFTGRSDFQKSEPCVINIITGQTPSAQSAWRIDFFKDGYRAFFRPVADHRRQLQLSLYCDETVPGQLFLSMDIAGPSSVISDAITDARLILESFISVTTPYYVSQIDDGFTRITVKIPKAQTLNFLTKANALSLVFNVTPPYNTIFANTYLSNSRKALVFAANQCLNR